MKNKILLRMKYVFKIILFLSILIITKSNIYSQNTQHDSVNYGIDTIVYDGNTYANIAETVKIKPPAYFKPFKNQNAFIHIRTSSTIQVNIIEDTPYNLITAKMNEEYFYNQGFTLVSKEVVKTSEGKEGILYIVSFKVKDIEFERMMFFTGSYHQTIWVQANYPVLMKKLLFNVIKAGVLSVKF